MKSIKIFVHSFVDLITNSSTEIYISASEKTIESIEKLVDNILTLGKSEYKCRDLFDISLDLKGFCQDYYYDDRENKDETPEQFMEREVKESGYDNYRSVKIKVSSKIKGKAAEEAASVLSSLTSLFDIDSSYNG